MTMSRPDLRRITLLLAATLPLAVLSAATPVAGPDPSERALSVDALRRALASRPVTDGVLRDDVEFFENRLATMADDPLALRRMASTRLLRFRAYNTLEELTAAEPVLARLSARYPADAGVHGLVASSALARHDFVAALDAARAAVRAGGDDAEAARLTLFDALWATGRYAEARTLLESTRAPRESAARLAREARLIDGLGDTDVARDRMERVVQLVDAYAETGVVRAWARVELATFTVHSGDPAGAVRHFLDALDIIPGYPAALEGLGWIAYGVDHDLAAAEALLERSVRYGSHLDLLPVLSEIATERGAPDRAEVYAEEFRARAGLESTERRMYWRPLAMAAADRGDLVEALALAEADLAQRQDRGAWATRGRILHLMGRTQEAVADMDRALAWGTPEPGVHALAGPVYLAAGHDERGRRAIEAALDGRAELGPVAARDLENLLAASARAP